MDDAAGQPADRQGLQPDLARAAHQGKEETFAAEHPVADAPDEFYVEINGRLIGDYAAGVDF